MSKSLAPKSLALAKAARRRAIAADCVRLAPRYVAGVAVATGAAIVLTRYLHLSFSWQSVVIAAASIAIAGSAFHSFVRRWSVRHAAARVDGVLGLNDQIGSAIELSNADGADRGFAALAIGAAEKVALTADVSRAVTLRWWSRWWIGSLAGASLAAAAWFYSPVPAANAVTKSQARKALQEARQVAIAQEPSSTTQVSKPELQELAQIEKELAQGTTTPADAATRAASVLERVADERTKSADTARTETEDVRDSLARAASSPTNDQSPADSSALRNALQTGDLEKASLEAEKLAENAERLSPQERSLLEKDLRELAQALDEQARENAVTAQAAQTDRQDREAVDSPPQDKSESANDAASENPQPPSAAPTKAISDAARQAAQELKRPANPPSSPSGAKPAESEAAKNAEKNEPDSGEAKKESQEQQGDQSQKNDAAEKNPSESGKSESSKPSSEEKGGEKAGQKTGEKSQEPAPASGDPTTPPQQNEGKQPATGEKNGAASQQTQGKPASGKQAAPDDKNKQGQSQTQGQQQSPGSTESGNKERQGPGEKQSGQDQPSSQGSPQETGPKSDDKTSDKTSDMGSDKAGDKAGDKEQGQQTGAKEQAGGGEPKQQDANEGSGSGLQKLARELKNLKQKSQDAAKDQTASKQMREQARKMLDEMDPAQREELQKLANSRGGGQAQGTGPGDTPQTPGNKNPEPKEWSGASKIVDFRTAPGDSPTPGKERVISDWQKNSPDGERAASQSGAAMEEDIRQAREGAERAIEQQSVPAQHRDLVRRVFEKFNARVDRTKKTAPAAPAPDAKPAKPVNPAQSGGR